MAMRNEARQRAIKSIAMPRIGAGLGRLVWSEVLHVIDEKVGSHLGIIIATLPQREEGPLY